MSKRNERGNAAAVIIFVALAVALGIWMLSKKLGADFQTVGTAVFHTVVIAGIAGSVMWFTALDRIAVGCIAAAACWWRWWDTMDSMALGGRSLQEATMLMPFDELTFANHPTLWLVKVVPVVVLLGIAAWRIFKD